MDFRTPVRITPHIGLLDHSVPVMLLGSCFSDHIAAHLRDNLFDVTVNPFGPLYNPASILAAVQRIFVDTRAFTPDEMLRHHGIWHSMMHHSSFSGHDADEVLNRINSVYAKACEASRRVKVCFVTLGSTRRFTLRATGRVVTNCHKLPADEFIDEPMSLEEVEGRLAEIVKILTAHGIRTVFTVSPIRHQGTSLQDNSLSKATLRVAVERVAARTDALYFPAYEIMMDDLRDYRFYAADMIHPSDVAVDYIYSRLAEATMSTDTRHLAEQCRRLTKRICHRPILQGPEARRFREVTSSLIEQFVALHPEVKTALDNYINS